MLNAHRVHTALPASDLHRAERFYEEKLGLTPKETRGTGLRYEFGDGSVILLFPSDVITRGGHTQAGIEVDDVDASVRQLRSRGVAFEESSSREFETVDGVATSPDGSRAAWFKDSEGNLLALVEFA